MDKQKEHKTNRYLVSWWNVIAEFLYKLFNHREIIRLQSEVIDKQFKELAEPLEGRIERMTTLPDGSLEMQLDSPIFRNMLNALITSMGEPGKQNYITMTVTRNFARYELTMQRIANNALTPSEKIGQLTQTIAAQSDIITKYQQSIDLFNSLNKTDVDSMDITAQALQLIEQERRISQIEEHGHTLQECINNPGCFDDNELTAAAVTVLTEDDDYWPPWDYTALEKIRNKSRLDQLKIAAALIVAEMELEIHKSGSLAM